MPLPGVPRLALPPRLASVGLLAACAHPSALPPPEAEAQFFYVDVPATAPDPAGLTLSCRLTFATPTSIRVTLLLHNGGAAPIATLADRFWAPWPRLADGQATGDLRWGDPYLVAWPNPLTTQDVVLVPPGESRTPYSWEHLSMQRSGGTFDGGWWGDSQAALPTRWSAPPINAPR